MPELGLVAVWTESRVRWAAVSYSLLSRVPAGPMFSSNDREFRITLLRECIAQEHARTPDRPPRSSNPNRGRPKLAGARARSSRQGPLHSSPPRDRNVSSSAHPQRRLQMASYPPALGAGLRCSPDAEAGNDATTWQKFFTNRHSHSNFREMILANVSEKRRNHSSKCSTGVIMDNPSTPTMRGYFSNSIPASFSKSSASKTLISNPTLRVLYNFHSTEVILGSGCPRNSPIAKATRSISSQFLIRMLKSSAIDRPYYGPAPQK